MDNFNINLNRGFPRRNLLNERPEHAAQTRLIQDIDSLRRDVSMMSNSLMNVYNLMQSTHMAVLNMKVLFIETDILRLLGQQIDIGHQHKIHIYLLHFLEVRVYHRHHQL